MLFSAAAALVALATSTSALVPGLGDGQTGNLSSGHIPTLPAPLNGQDPLLPDLLGPLLGNNTFDYVIVGAGTSGMTLAARLSEDPDIKVAVIEAGIDYAAGPLPVVNQELVNIPGADTVGCGGGDIDAAIQSAIDWGYKTVPQQGAANREVHYARGKTLGGTSTRNFMLNQFPTRGSLAKWVALTGDPSWSFEARQPDYKRVFDFTPPKHELRQEIPEAQYNPNDWGSDSPLIHASYANTPSNFSHFMQQSVNQKGIRTTRSFNGGSLLGVQYCPTTINPNGGIRSTSRDAYVVASKRPNLTIYTGALAKRIVLSNDTTPRARGVLFSSSAILADKLTLFGVHATREVIVSGGAFNSPQLLMVSGIGPRDQLTAQGIPVIVENKNVGQGMEDHVFVGPTFKVNPATNTLTDLAANPVYLAAQFANFSTNQLGLLTNPVADLLAWERIPPATAAAIGAGILNTYPSDWPHIEHFSGAGFVGNFQGLFQDNLARGADGSRFATILAAIVAPRSRGTVTLNSADTGDLPNIDPKWLVDPVDQAAAVYGFKRAREFFSAQAMQPVLAEKNEYYPGAAVSTDAQILQHVKENLMTVWHASCTCKMATRDQGGVLDSKLQVYGTQGLRVIDASSFPMLPPGHPQSTCYMLAERGATLIKQARVGRSVADAIKGAAAAVLSKREEAQRL